MEENISYSIDSFLTARGIKELLQKNDLPTNDIGDQIRFIAAYDNEKLVGCIGLEQYSNHGLLRSFAVEHTYRSKGVGNELLNRLLKLCRASGIDKLHLLTTTADQYFLRKGFDVINREKAPDAIKLTTEFSSVCPASAVYMVLSL